jgi:dihydrodipicolinate synthase/N-acetylneuraminate lyase
LYELVKAGRHGEARALQQRLIPLARLLGPTYGVPGLKAALQIAGYDVGIPRPPLAPAPPAAAAALAAALAQLEEIPV